MSVLKSIEEICKKDVEQCTLEDIYKALISITNNQKIMKQGKKKLYYISAEFLIGRLLVNNLINLGIYNEVKEILNKKGISIDELEELEQEPSLGNGGLGRLASCFLDSVASLGLNGDGIGLCYHFGLFKQVFKDYMQTQEKNPWIEANRFLNETDISYNIKMGEFLVTSKLFYINIIGSEGKTNRLYLFDIDTVDETIVKNSDDYEKTDIKKNLTLFLYPDDSDEKGKFLRIYQQYFMVSNAACFILKECVDKGSNLYDLYDYAVIQINDTHPALIIPELIRQLIKRGIYIDDAIEIVSKTCAYTNHTILAEALEKWPVSYLKKAVPDIVPIIEILDSKIRRKFKNEKVYIIDENENVHMAHITIHFGFSINGVAKLHTKILKESELKDFFEIYPEKFNNKTNGITFRRWLSKANPELENYLIQLIGDGFKTDEEKLKKLLKYSNDKEVLKELIKIKENSKLKLKKYIYNKQNVVLDENSVFDIQIKRLHEYKRQQMNILYYISKYLEIKEGKIPIRPITGIFGAKAAPAYTIAKDIIHLILCMQELIRRDEIVSKYLNIVMVENYNVTWAEKLIPACDISEQISLASKEASGTGNMKLMLNGGITLGTEDGANVEIHNLVGDDNIYIFGADSNEVIDNYKKGDYNPMEYYKENEKIKKAVDFITGKELLKIGDKKVLERLKKELLNKDWFMTFLDFEDYYLAKEKALSDYKDRYKWAEKMLVNIANAGYFSSDRTIKEYNKDIWKL